MTVSCLGIFCEDIREEAGGTHTIVGVMPDNINLIGPAGPGGASLLFPKMGIYVRVNLDVSYKPRGPISARASIPGVPDISLGEIGPADIDKAFADAREKNNPLVGIIFKGVASPLPLSTSGVGSAFVTVEGQEHLAAIINIQIARP
jgi:hypothetical protein